MVTAQDLALYQNTVYKSSFQNCTTRIRCDVLGLVEWLKQQRTAIECGLKIIEINKEFSRNSCKING